MTSGSGVATFDCDPIATGLDIGSNTISCVQLLRTHRGEYEILKDMSIPVRLSEGLSPNGPLAANAVVRGLVAIERLRDTFALHTRPVRAVGTAVLRMTASPEVFVEPASDILGVPIEIIDGMTEAAFTCSGALVGLSHQETPVVLDVGGQSTEVSRLRADGRWEHTSMDVGVVGLTERFFGGGCTDERVQALRDYLRSLLKRHMAGWSGETLVAVGGTPTSLSMLVQGDRCWCRDRVHGTALSRKNVDFWFEKMRRIPVQKRIDDFGLRPMRADVFPAGLLVTSEIMAYLGIHRLTVSVNGLRVGLAISRLTDEGIIDA